MGIHTVPHVLSEDSAPGWKLRPTSPGKDTAAEAAEKGHTVAWSPGVLGILSMAGHSHSSVYVLPNKSCHVLLAGVRRYLIPAEGIKINPEDNEALWLAFSSEEGRRALSPW